MLSWHQLLEIEIRSCWLLMHQIVDASVGSSLDVEGVVDDDVPY